MRKLTRALLTILTVLLLTGCNTDIKAVTEAAEGFLNALVNSDLDAASQYATDDFMKSDTMKLMDPQYLADSFYEAMGITRDDIDEEAQKTVDDYVDQIVKRAYKDYEIQDVKVLDGNKASVTASITLGYNPDASSRISDDTQKIISDYQTEHYDELISIYTDEGEKAMYKKLYSDLIPIVIGKMQEQLESGETAQEKTVLSLEKIDKKWLVTDLEENRAGAAPAGATEESDAEAATSAEYAATDSTDTEHASEYMTDSDYAGTDEQAQESEPGYEESEEGSDSEDSEEEDSDGGENS